MDIHNIPIAKITEQYLDYLHGLEKLDVDVSADFIYMAATLIHIKSKMLLPTPPQDQEDGEGEAELPVEKEGGADAEDGHQRRGHEVVEAVHAIAPAIRLRNELGEGCNSEHREPDAPRNLVRPVARQPLAEDEGGEGGADHGRGEGNGRTVEAHAPRDAGDTP